jgi:hypothetical protein
MRCGSWAFVCAQTPTLAAENLSLRKQLALYQIRHVTPHQTTQATRMAVTWLARWFDWRQALVIVQPATLIRWHRQGFRLFWPYGPGEPHVGRGTDRQRTASQAWPTCLTADRAEVYAHAPEPWMTSTRPISGLAHLCAQSCPGDRHLRFLRGGHGHVSPPVCVCRDGTRHPPRPARQCDGAPHGAMDPTTVARCDPSGSCLPFPHP